MSRSPLISIIIPAHNSELYIQHCLNSALKQSYPNIEIIVIDDGSSDTTGKIIDVMAQKDHRIQAIHTQNQGVSAARNLGIQKCHGEYITFIDADDYIENGCVEYLYRLIQDNEADISISTTHNKFTTLSASKYKQYNPNEAIITSKDAINSILYYQIAINPGGKLFNKTIITQNHLCFNEKLQYGEDFCFDIMNFQEAKRIAIGHRPVYNYRLNNPNSATTQFQPKMVKSNLMAQQYIKNHIKTKDRLTQRALLYARWHTKYDCFNTLVGAKATSKYPSLYRSLRQDVKSEARHNIHQPIPTKDKLKAILYSIIPTTTAKLINYFYKRDFTVHPNVR